MSDELLIVDARGLMCPLPLLRLKQALAGIEAGQTLKISATDLAARLDFGVFLQQAGHRQIACEEEDGVLVFWIQKGR